MKSNKAFLGLSVAVAILAFAVFAFMSKSRVEPAPSTPAADVSLLEKSHSPVKGNRLAKVTIVEFLDPECEACRAMHPILQKLLAEYSGKVRLVIRYLPLHTNSVYAAAVLEEARERGKFEEALNLLFENQPEWGSHANPQPELIPGYLKDLSIPAESLEREKVIAKHREKIDIDQADARAVGASRTPTFFVNGEVLDQLGYEPMKAAIEKALAQ